MLQMCVTLSKTCLTNVRFYLITFSRWCTGSNSSSGLDKSTWNKMYLYNLTLQRATGIIQAVQGNFSGGKQQEIIIARGKVLEIVKPDPNTGKVHILLSQEVFGIIRSIISFRLTGGNKGKFFYLQLSGILLILSCVFRLCCGWIWLWSNCHPGI